MVKTLQKSSSPEPAGRFPRNLICFNDDSGVTLTCFTARSNLVTLAFLWGKSENSGFFRNYYGSDLKVGRSSHLMEYMKVYEY